MNTRNKFFFSVVFLTGLLLSVVKTQEAVQMAIEEMEAKSFSFDAENVEYVGHIGGSTSTTAASGNYAYTNEGPRLVILDITNPSIPSVVGKTSPLPNSPVDITINEELIYVADWVSGLQIVDVSKVENPNVIGSIDTPGWAYGIVVSGEYAYIADGDSGLRIINVSNPNNPTEVSFLDTSGFAYGLAVSNGYAYIADGSNGLRIINITDPTNPFEVGFYDSPGSASNVAVEGDYAYLADFYSLRVIDVSNPVNPIEISYFEIPSGTTRHVSVSGNYAYIGYESKGLRILDISDPVNPMEVGRRYTENCVN